jgi:endonuclease-8
VPEGDSLRRAAERLRALEGQVLAVDAPHPRAAALGIAERIDGRRLERVEAVGKNLLLTFEGDVVVRSHLRMRGRWRLQAAGSRVVGTPWLVLRGRELEAVLWHGPVLELGKRAVDRLGPDIMNDPPDLDAMLRRFRAADQRRELGDALLDQRLVSGIGNMWKAEALHRSGASPWARLAEVSDADLCRVLDEAAQAMRAPRRPRLVYRRAGLPCGRCGARIAARRQGEGARTAYWCPSCQLPPPALREGPQAGTAEGGA